MGSVDRPTPLDNFAGCTFSLDSLPEKRELALTCWGANGNMLELLKLSTDNVQLTALLKTLMRNTYRPSNSEACAEQRALRIESILSVLVRAGSQKQMTLITAK
eukprot:2184133-Pleurochrysis_carterae.AAC.1